MYKIFTNTILAGVVLTVVTRGFALVESSPSSQPGQAAQAKVAQSEAGRVEKSPEYQAKQKALSENYEKGWKALYASMTKAHATSQEADGVLAAVRMTKGDWSASAWPVSVKKAENDKVPVWTVVLRTLMPPRCGNPIRYQGNMVFPQPMPLYISVKVGAAKPFNVLGHELSRGKSTKVYGKS